MRTNLAIRTEIIRAALTRLALAALLSVTGLVAAPASARAGKPLEGQELAERYKTCWEQFNKKQWDEFAKCYDANSTSVAPGLPAARGAKAIIETHAKPVAAAMPDVAGEIQLMLVSGRRAATVTLFRGTHTGPLKGPMGEIPPTNKKIGQFVAHAIESGPGAIATKEWFVQDGGTMMAQLGLSKQPARPRAEKGWGPNPMIVVASDSKTEQQNLAALKKWYAGFNARKPSFAVLSDDVIDHDQAAPADLVGKPSVSGFIEGLQKMSSNIKMKSTSTYAAGDYTVAINECTGTNDGEMPAFGLTKPTGKKFKLDIIEVLRWEGGKIKEVWPFIDGVQMATQLGLIPPAPPAATTARK